MENKGLLFIPDISGFTRFVNAVEIEHSRFIIQELLETLIKTKIQVLLFLRSKEMQYYFTNLAISRT